MVIIANGITIGIRLVVMSFCNGFGEHASERFKHVHKAVQKCFPTWVSFITKRVVMLITKILMLAGERKLQATNSSGLIFRMIVHR